MIAVYLRHNENANGRFLCECGALEVEGLVDDMREQGVYWEGGVYREMEYQYALDNTSAYAEIILMGVPE